MTGTPTAPAESEVADLVRSIAATHGADEGPLMVVLHDVQRQFGYIDRSWVALIADELNLSRAEVHGVISFYHDFRSEPAGLTTVKVCRAEACQSVGANALAAHARESLGVEFGETTPDGSVTLGQVFCLGNCALGPTVQVDGVMHGRVDNDRFDRLVSQGRR
jgi:formate dehydrogenase subunit gamma